MCIHVVRDLRSLFVMQGNGSPDEQLVVARPEVRHEALDETSQFLIVACDGIWDILSNEQAVHFVEQQALEGKTPKEICEALCDRCLAPSTEGVGKGCDNMSAIVVFLQKQHAELAAGEVPQIASAARATSASAAAPGPHLPGGFSPPGQAMGSSFTSSSPSKSQSSFGSGQQLSLPKRFVVRRSQVQSTSVRAQSMASMHNCSLSAIM